MIEYTCKKCRTPLENEDAQEATPDKCPVCGSRYMVPLKPISYKCTHCGAKLTSPDSLGGRQDTCPMCHQLCDVPLSKRQREVLQRKQDEELQRRRAAEQERQQQERALSLAALQQADAERRAHEAEVRAKTLTETSSAPAQRALTHVPASRKKKWLSMKLGSVPLVLAGLLGAGYLLSQNGTLGTISPALNPPALQGPMNDVLRTDYRNSGIKVSVYYGDATDTSVLVYDLVEVAATSSKADVFRVLLQYAEKMRSKDFSEVRLAHNGKVKFTLRGTYFQELGRDYATENPLFTIRTFPEHLRTASGIDAYGHWEGGILGVANKQMEDFADFHQKWYGNAD